MCTSVILTIQIAWINVSCFLVSSFSTSALCCLYLAPRARGATAAPANRYIAPPLQHLLYRFLKLNINLILYIHSSIGRGGASDFEERGGNHSLVGVQCGFWSKSSHTLLASHNIARFVTIRSFNKVQLKRNVNTSTISTASRAITYQDTYYCELWVHHNS